jgi:DNA polymerase-3 subunit alpha
MKVRKVVLEEQVHTLFKTESIHYKTPELLSSKLEDAFDEMEYIGYPLGSPFDLLTIPLKENIFASDLLAYIGKIVTVYAYYVTAKRTMTSKTELMYFGTFLDRKGDFIDTVHFPVIAKKYPLRGRGIYQLTGKVTAEFDCISIEVSYMEKLSIIQDPRYKVS